MHRLVVLLILALTAGLPAQRILHLEDVLSKKTLAFASVGSANEYVAASESMNLYKLSQDPACQKFFAPFMKHYKRVEAQVENSGAFSMILERIRPFRISVALPSISITGALGGAMDAAGQSQNHARRSGGMNQGVGIAISALKGVVVCLDAESFDPDNPTEMLDQFHELVTQQIGPMLSEEAEIDFPPAEEMMHRGVRTLVWPLKVENLELTICAGQVNNLLLVSLDPSVIRRAINFSKTERARPLATAESFKSGRARAGGENRPLLELYLSTGGALKGGLVELIPGWDDLSKGLDHMGVLGLESFHFMADIRDGDEHDTIYIHAPSPRKGLLDLAGGNPLSQEILSMVPSSALAAVGMRLDLSKALDDVMTGTSMSPTLEEANRKLLRNLDRFQRFMGLDLREEVLAHFGSEMVVYANMDEAPLRLPSITAIVECTDAPAALEAIQKLTASTPLHQKHVLRGDDKVTVLWHERRLPTTVALTTRGSHLLISMTLPGLQRALDHLDDQGSSILDANEFQETMSQFDMSTASGFFYLDTPRFIPLLMDGLQAAAPLYMEEQLGRVPLDFFNMPDGTLVASHLNGLGGVMGGDEGGLFLTSRSLGLPSALALGTKLVTELPGDVPDVLSIMAWELSEMDARPLELDPPATPDNPYGK